MKRAILALALFLIPAAAWAQVPMGPYSYGGWPYGYGGFGTGGYGIGYGYGYGGYGFGYPGFGGAGFWPYGFAARGYYPSNPYGNMNWLPPILPSPYYSVPTDRQYVQQTIIRDQQTYGDLIREHREQNNQNGQK